MESQEYEGNRTPDHIFVVSQNPRAINGIGGKDIELFDELEKLYGKKIDSKKVSSIFPANLIDFEAGAEKFREELKQKFRDNPNSLLVIPGELKINSPGYNGWISVEIERFAGLIKDAGVSRFFVPGEGIVKISSISEQDKV